MSNDAHPCQSFEEAADQLFTQVSRSILLEHRSDDLLEARLWRLSDFLTTLAFQDAPADCRARGEAVAHRLRLQSVDLINHSVDRIGAAPRLVETLRRARAQLSLRPWRSGDRDRFAELLSNENVWKLLPDAYPGPLGPMLAGQLIDISNNSPARHFVRAVEWQGDVVGQVRLQLDSSRWPDSAEISYWLGEGYWNRGLATGIVTLFTVDCFAARPELQRIFADVLQGNGASKRVLEKSAYRFESTERLATGSKAPIDRFGAYRADYGSVFDLTPLASGHGSAA